MSEPARARARPPSPSTDTAAAPEYQRQGRVRAPEPVRETNPVSPDAAPDVSTTTSRPCRFPTAGASSTRSAISDRWFDPYNRNILKADKPVHDDWFFNLGVISDTVVEVRDVPTPVGLSSTRSAGEIDVFGNSDQTRRDSEPRARVRVLQGRHRIQTAGVRVPVHAGVQRELHASSKKSSASTRTRATGARAPTNFVGIQEAFVDKHLRNVSDRFDFDSIRVGIQPFSSDFRGFLFQDNQLGVRLFGNRRNNVNQYNLAWFRRIEKDTNSGLNDVGKSLRDDDIFIANLYWQDLPVPRVHLAGSWSRTTATAKTTTITTIRTASSFGPRRSASSGRAVTTSATSATTATATSAVST